LATNIDFVDDTRLLILRNLLKTKMCPKSPASRLTRKTNGAVYDASRSLRGLRARGLEEKNLWIVLGDHGKAFGQHEGNFGHTSHLYDESVHVSFLIAAPALISHEIRSRQVVSLIDTAPTVLDLVGPSSPQRIQTKMRRTTRFISWSASPARAG
jgi:arylsulfatase A-like enzyme